MISREEATEIARAEMRRHWPSYELGKVMTLEEIGTARLNVYGDSLTDCWIAYLHPTSLLGLVSSTIIVVDRSSGAIRYQGRAGDEG